MKTTITLLLFAFVLSLNAQSGKYNTDKGFIAEGFDVVSYFSNTAKEGNTKYVTTHDGVKFKFSSQANLDSFKKTPEKYTPQYGGYCAYAMAVKGQKIESDPETFEIRGGKLYLFYNSWGNNTLKSWLKGNPSDLIIAANTNWKKAQ